MYPDNRAVASAGSLPCEVPRRTREQDCDRRHLYAGTTHCYPTQSGYVHMLLSGTAKSRVVQHNWDRDSVHTAEQDLNGRTPMPKQISVFDQSRLARMFQLIQSFLNGSCSRRDPGSNPGIRFCLVLVGRTFVSESKEKNPQVPYSMQSEKASLQVSGA